MAVVNSPTSERRILAAERARQALSLRLAGATFAQIGERLGVTAPAAYKMIVRHLSEVKRQSAETAEELRALEIQRLDALQAALWTDAMRGDEQKVDRILRVMNRRAALLGLDEPAKHKIENAVTIEGYDYITAIAHIAPRSVGDSQSSSAS